jgi:DNA-binding transcriptional regulator YhcF (GntR family)
MSDDDNKGQLGFPQWKPTLQFFHIFQQMIANGDARKMGGTAFLVYAVIKARINYSSGRTFPTVATIAHDAGINEKTARRHMKTLVEMGYLKKKFHKNRSNTYRIVESLQVPVTTDEGKKEFVTTTFDYVPAGVGKAIREIRNLKMKGALPDGSSVKIENLTVNIQVNPNAQNPQQIIVKEPASGKFQKYIDTWNKRGEGIDDSDLPEPDDDDLIG